MGVALDVLTAASVTTIVALALLPALMVFHCSMRPNWAASALGCAVSWLFTLFATAFVGLSLAEQRPQYFADGGVLDLLINVVTWVGCVLFAAALGFVLLRRRLQAKQNI